MGNSQSVNRFILSSTSFVYIIPSIMYYNKRYYTGSFLYMCVVISAFLYHYKQTRFSQNVTDDIYVFERTDFIFANISAIYSILTSLKKYSLSHNFLVIAPVLLCGLYFKERNCECTYPVFHSLWHIISAYAVTLGI